MPVWPVLGRFSLSPGHSSPGLCSPRMARSPQRHSSAPFQINGLRADGSSGWIAALPTRRGTAAARRLSVPTLPPWLDSSGPLNLLEQTLRGLLGSRILLGADTRSIVSGPTSSPATGRRNGSKHSSGAYFGSTRSFPEPVRLSEAMPTDPDLRTWVQFRKRESNWRPGLGSWLMTSAGQNW